MFQKKEMIFSENMGVCRVEKIVKLSAEKNVEEGIPYYVLCALDGKKSYIPVEHHQVLLRPLLDAEEAKQRLSQADKKALTPQELAEITYVLDNAGKEGETR